MTSETKEKQVSRLERSLKAIAALPPSEQLQAQKAAARDKRRYVKITWDGSSCICEPREVGDMTDGCDGAVLTDVWMTPDEWENLPEFAGW